MYASRYGRKSLLVLSLRSQREKGRTMFHGTYRKVDSRSSIFAKRKNFEIPFLPLLLTALLMLTGFPAVAHAQESGLSFNSVDSVVADTQEQRGEKEVTSQEQEALDNLESVSTRNEDSATDAFAVVQQQTNTALQATAPRATEVFIFRIKVTADDLSFSIPTSGGGLGQTYDWWITWGDTTQQYTSGIGSSAGIEHTYFSPGVYRIIIYPRSSSNTAAWLAAFGFSTDDQGANAQANRDKMYDVESPLTPSMTRDVAASTVPHDEWRYTFSRCRNLTMGDDFTFSDEWNSITAVGDNFASDMFSGCEAALTMGSIFNLPQNLTSVGDNFAGNMFAGCNGDAFAMNGVFNLPQNLANAGDNFASNMFEGCSGYAFTMNNAFNLPQNLGSVGDNFASNMFSRAGGPSFQVNGVFAFPRFDSSVLNQTGMFEGAFQKLASTTPTQNRLAQGIIGDPDYVPTTAQGTFTGADCFSDRAYIAVNWGGDGISRDITISFDTASQGLTCTNPPGDVTIERNTAVTKPAPDPHVDGYAFDNWYTTSSFDTVWDFSNTCSDAMTLYARFVPLDIPAPAPNSDTPSRQTLARTGDAGMFGGLALAGTAGVALAFMVLARAKRKAKDL